MKNKEYLTDNLALAAAISIFLPLIEIRPYSEQPDKFSFVFADNGSAEEIVARYWRDDLVVSPLRYSQELKNIKSRIFEAKRYDR